MTTDTIDVATDTIDVIVDEIKYESPYIKSFKLVPADGLTLLRSGGGSHIKTYVQHNQGTLENHYSLTNDPDEDNYYRIAVRRCDPSKGGSIYWHDSITKGDKIKISYPKNHFPLSFSAKHHVFIAAGIGITPFLSMAADLKKKGKSFELHYAARSKDMCAFHSFINSNYSKETTFYFSSEGNRMSTELMKNKPIGTHVYFCGPESMVKEYSESAELYGYPTGKINFEFFTPPETGPKEPFQVTLNKSNKVIQVSEEETLLDSLLRHDIDAPYSCKIGGCGSCLVDVLEGEVDHRDLFLTDKEKEERNVICTCISRAKDASLVLDL